MLVWVIDQWNPTLLEAPKATSRRGGPWDGTEFLSAFLSPCWN